MLAISRVDQSKSQTQLSKCWHAEVFRSLKNLSESEGKRTAADVCGATHAGSPLELSAEPTWLHLLAPDVLSLGPRTPSRAYH